MNTKFNWLHSLNNLLTLPYGYDAYVQELPESRLTITNKESTLSLVIIKLGSFLQYDLKFRNKGLKYTRHYRAIHSLNNWKQFIEKDLRFIDRFKYRKDYSVITYKEFQFLT